MSSINGAGKLDEHVCIVYREQGFIENEFVMHEISKIMLQYKKYNVAINLYSTESDESKGIHMELLYHKIQVTSRLFTQDILDKFQVYYQVRIIEDFSPKSFSVLEKFKNPTDVLLDIILSYLKNKEAKDKVYKWFRYERNIFFS
ncbi:hypothetical protein ACFSCX_17070 [Bacillus salitolerans]|uniref:Uncharacterized protein n=1 Tax=Bacillus salitolerans TaxID=1437434 RepID=A0ABW4LSW4_9BACI